MLDSQAVLDVQAFLETGGGVLTFIGVVTLVMWTLMLERFWYFYRVFPKVSEDVQRRWQSREDHASWDAHQVRRLLVSELRMQLEAGLPYIRVLVALCPLLGLLGTVTGMIEVFDVMAIAGSGNAKAMAGGVSKATIPTMAGMVAALSGLILSARLEQFAANEGERLADRLEIEHGGD
ncbi:MAG TPA: MotA/TolQ/ExbB proton channel family protein [Myxococcota bacterium]|nr:MotA/TolQ/ExbB proton channel family protein [Myxococcota bacterium]